MLEGYWIGCGWGRLIERRGVFELEGLYVNVIGCFVLESDIHSRGVWMSTWSSNTRAILLSRSIFRSTV